MRTTRRLLVTTALAGALVLTGIPGYAVEFDPPTYDLVEAQVDVTDELDDAGGDSRRSDTVEAPISFTGLWVEMDEPTEEPVFVRTSPDGDDWSPWSEIATVDEEDGPDPGTAEDAAAEDGARFTDLVVVDDEADHFQLEVPAEVGDVQVHLADSSGANDSLWVRTRQFLGRSAAPAEATGTITRAQWGADEGRSRNPSIAGNVRMVVVHHTASSNTYTRDGAANQMRIFQNYHMSLGWSDIGYNAVVDRFGRIYEGRRGGIDRAVIGAHASGFNTGSFGVAVMGNFESQQAPQVAIDAVTRIVRHKAGVHGFDTNGTVHVGGRDRPVVVGHRDVGNTACPGRIQQKLPEIRAGARLAPIANVSPFSDIHEGHTHGRAVLELHAAGIVNGCAPRRFCPSQDLTRGQAASLLARTLGLPDGDGQRFRDVGSANPHAGAIGAVAARGIVTGYDDDTFGPDQPLTREQMATLLARTLKLQPYRGRGFTDVPANSIHGPNVYAVFIADITKGCTVQQFCPRDHVTRAQMASFIHRMRDRL